MTVTTDRTPYVEIYPAKGSSPWGQVDAAYSYPGGMRQVCTPGHGGVWVPAKLNRLIPPALRNDARADRNPTTTAGGWYEEDCEWAIPFYFLAPHLPEITDHDRSEAEGCLQRWFADEMATVIA